MNLPRRNLFKRLVGGCAAAGLARLAQAAPADKPGEKAFNLSLRNGRLESKNNTLRVRRGERVELRFSTDRPIQLHLHGYDIEAGASPESPATISFTADIPGRFPVSEHAHGKAHDHGAVLYLEVHP